MSLIEYSPLMRRLARYRVALGFALAPIVLWLARPTLQSFWIGLAIMIAGEGLRIWAAGHIDKGREVTRSGPYRIARHPLYLGSAILGLGFAVAARSWIVAAAAAIYLILTLTAAIRTEEAALDQRFAGEYSAYREGRLAAVPRRFELARVMRNREYRAVLGIVLAVAVLYIRLSW